MEKFKNYKFRASSVGNLMTRGRRKDDIFGETSKSYLQEIYIKEIYNREKYISNKYMQKGILQEEDSLDLLSEYFNRLLIKNKDYIKNDYVLGTPDVIEDDQVIDIKTSWDIFTFFSSKDNPIYYWQLQSYMWLANKKKATLAYCLTDAPDFLIAQEARYRARQTGDDEGEVYAQMLKELTYSDIPIKDRVKIINYERNDEDIEQLKDKITKAREYLTNF
jgi:hypothetical protein